jgi:hypothetical protein
MIAIIPEAALVHELFESQRLVKQRRRLTIE